MLHNIFVILCLQNSLLWKIPRSCRACTLLVFVMIGWSPVVKRVQQFINDGNNSWSYHLCFSEQNHTFFKPVSNPQLSPPFSGQLRKLPLTNINTSYWLQVNSNRPKHENPPSQHLNSFSDLSRNFQVRFKKLKSLGLVIMRNAATMSRGGLFLSLKGKQ